MTDLSIEDRGPTSTGELPNEGNGSLQWKRNLFVCFFGSFTTIFAMTLVLPFLPVYIEQLGAQGHAAIVQWSGIAYAATFLSAGMVAPLWGRLGDRYGRKPMLVRASFGMALIMALTGIADNVWQFVGLRFLTGLAGGYSSGAMILVAVQTPKSKSAWALGVLSVGAMAGNLAGPLAGGYLPPLIGIRTTFICAGALIFLAFLSTVFLIAEDRNRVETKADRTGGARSISNKLVVYTMLATGFLLMVANMSIEPIITIFVQTLPLDAADVTAYAGVVMAATALGSILSAAWLGRIADEVGYATVIVMSLGCAGLLLIPQAFVTDVWQLVALRFLMGLALGGLLPCIASVIRHNVDERSIGAVMGYSISAQFGGQIIGPLFGGFVGGHIGMAAVFIGTSGLMFAGAAFSWLATRSATISKSNN